MKPYRTVNEMLWKPDAQYEEARKLPEWAAFHRLCGKSGLCFDFPEREGRGYRMVAFHPKKLPNGGWQAMQLTTGRGKTVMEAMTQAYEQCGRSVPGAAEMLARGLVGTPAAQAPEEIDNLFGEPSPATDAFEDLFA